MIKFLFLTIPNQYTYDNLKTPLKFKQDIYGVTTWTMKHPLTIYSADLQFKHVFKLNEVKVDPVINPTLQQKWRYFVITKRDGGSYYCTSQIIYEKGVLKTSQSLSQSQFFSAYSPSLVLSGQEFYLPRCIVLVSQLPYFKLQVNLLKIHKELKKQEPAISHCIEEDLYEMYLDYLQTGREKEWETLNLNEINSKRKTYCPLQLSFSYYVECCNSHTTGQCIYIQKAASREVLHLYKLSSSTLYQIGYFFHLPLSALNLRKIISAILTEKQIVFSSSNPNLTVMVIETFMQMILPLKWCYMYAPNLPVELIQAAQESFMPYIVGISKQYLPLISNTNKIIVHIDTDEIEMNYEQQEDDLRLLSKKFQKFLIWKNNSNKQYLEWQKELRINSILLITTIFKKDMPIDRESGGKKFSSEDERVSEEKFYEEFLSKSMMYRKLIEDVHEKVYSEFYKLTKMDFNERRVVLQNKFNSLHSQTIYPTKCDNKKEWIRFYEKYMRQKKKVKLNRHSLSMVEHNLNGLSGQGSIPQPFYGSNISLNNIGSSKKVEGVTVNQNNSLMQQNMPNYQKGVAVQQQSSYRNNYQSNRNNQLYQSSVSSHSVNSFVGGLKFNMQASNTGNRSSSKDIYRSNRGSNSIHNDETNWTNFHKNNSFVFNSGNLNNVSSQDSLNSRNFNTNTINPHIIQNTINTNPVLHGVSQVENYTMENAAKNNNFIQHNVNSQQSSNQTIFSSKSLQGNLPETVFMSKNKHSSMIFNQNPTQHHISNHPLNQSMVASFIFPHSQNMNNPPLPSINNFSNTSSQRNLNVTQSTIVL